MSARDDLIEAAKEIIANGCGCHRECEDFPSADVYCGCEKDAAEIVDLVLNTKSEVPA